MARYLTWRHTDGSTFDPLIRVHERIGGEVLRAAALAMRVTGAVAQGETWTGVALPDSGSYVVRGGLVPLLIDRAEEIGRSPDDVAGRRGRP